MVVAKALDPTVHNACQVDTFLGSYRHPGRDVQLWAKEIWLVQRRSTNEVV